MCAHYFIRMDEHDNQSIAEEVQRRYGPLLSDQPDENIVPTKLAPVLCRDRRGGTGYFMMHFGLKTGSSLIINARSESIQVKPLFRSLINRRCLIPANAYTEWKHTGRERIPYLFESPRHSLMYFAGLYQLTPGEKFGNFVILTREAAPDYADIHSRMPLILKPDVYHDWLNPETDIESLTSSFSTELTYSTPQLSFLF